MNSTSSLSTTKSSLIHLLLFVDDLTGSPSDEMYSTLSSSTTKSSSFTSFDLLRLVAGLVTMTSSSSPLVSESRSDSCLPRLGLLTATKTWLDDVDSRWRIVDRFWSLVDLLDGVAFSIMFCPLRRPDFRRSEAGRGQLYPSSSVCGAIGEEGGSLSG